MKFLGNVLATIVGLFVFCMLFFFGILFIAAIFGGGSATTFVEDNSVLELNLEEVTNDYGGKFNFAEIGYYEAKHDGLTDILKAIDAAKTDDKIKGISILNNTLALGVAQTKALRDELEIFKKSGKFIMAYGNVYSQKDYYLNSVANTVYLNPVGELDFKGLSTEVMYYKDFQDKTGLKMEVIRHGKYKSAVEPFLLNEMSPENRDQITTFLTSIWNSMVNDISKSRKISIAQLNTIATGLLARTPELALKNKLIDKIAYEDVYHDDIRKALKVAANEDYKTVNIIDYAQDIATSTSDSNTKDKIAVIYAQGEIGSGEGDINTVGEGSMRRSLQEARKDDNIKAIVLRVNSPGGSALTSDLIWREIEITKKVKPVIVSMGNLAASGGYYIACNANKIFAEASTITGSIGVFGTLPNLSAVTKKYGINTELVETHENASGYSLFKPLEDNFRQITQEGVEHIYNVFVTRVAKGRKMTFAQVDAIAQGRVWAGSDALRLGLVDKIGGLDDALAYASNLVKLKEYSTVDYPKYEKDFKELFSGSGLPFMKSRENLIKEEIGIENYKIIEQIRKMNAQKGVQAIMPFEINVK
ncbi:signal peptide peptidase SppA [Flavobacterium psychrophilum]|uniref:Protease IV (Signal peptide peptidase) n=5 Tax=Flavobacterium psychrophilum TaxID=96345 RepID=A6GWN7_FLAPJ|nr:signal peptide peptidase SppA [Flavobacterium psychrophilum]AIG29315.1 protease IV [Flavobacterium psychrophilum]AIG31592.1 protease IV [Flavobacterium psychrophilum]AIG33746.1 protease IV [Flavobacterium psychrophilum]AIG36108.1 protease IV [Flavobacterium psychrophilum]AIG38374.1 protease IV [Flavobacterium psychrophilum]